MTHALVLLLALLIGVVAGLRAITAPAVVAWAAFLDWINMSGTWASWVGNWITVTVLTILAVAELVTDQLPKTPSRKTPVQFVTRLRHRRLRRRGASAPRGATPGAAWGPASSARCWAPSAATRRAAAWYGQRRP